MDTGEKLMALEQIIAAYAINQFAANGISPVLARVIMKNVYGQFQEDCIKELLGSRIEMSTGEERADVNEEL